MWSSPYFAGPVSVLRALFAGLALCVLPSISSAQNVSGDSSEEPFKLSFGIHQGRLGPWGELEYFPMILEPSDFYIGLNPDLKNFETGTIWGFEAAGVDEVLRILSDAGFDTALARQLVGPDFLQDNETTGLLEIRPPEGVIYSMTDDQRRRLYPQLRPNSELYPFSNPFSLHPDGLLVYPGEDCGVRSELISLVDKLSYRSHSLKNPIRPNRFADIYLALQKANDAEERWRLIKTLCRDVTISARLKISSQSDVQTLADFWSSGGRNKEILPILKSVAETSGVETLDIVHLLPPGPRKLLHTYPSPNGEGIGDDLPDCFWTSFSFFGDSPSARHLDFIGHVFEERYLPVPPPYQLGDLILIRDRVSGRYLHACNYLADDLVFTKNGQSLGRAWLISKLNTVLEAYRRSDSIEVIFARLKPEFQR